jgi:hypothetical protein
MVMWLGTIQKEIILENKGGILKHEALGRVKGVVGTCNRDPHIRV